MLGVYLLFIEKGVRQIHFERPFLYDISKVGYNNSMFTYSGDTKEFTHTLIYDNQKYTHSNRISQEPKKRIWQITYAQEVGSHHKKGWVCLITCKGD